MSGVPWSKDEIQKLRECADNGLTATAIHRARIFPHRSRAAIGFQMSQQRIEVKHAPTTEDTAQPKYLSLEKRVTVLTEKLRAAEEKLKSAYIVENHADEIKAAIAEHTTPLSPLPQSLLDRTRAAIERSRSDEPTVCDAVLLLSDEHADEVIQTEATWGLERYNFDVFRVRLSRLMRVVQDYVSVHLPAHHFQRLWVFKLGDGVHGDIHGAGPNNHFKNTLKAAVAVGDAEAQFIQGLIPLFPGGVHVVAVSGNHPRRCLDDSTEVWTRRGWLRYTDLRKDDEVYGINTVRDRGEWQPIEAVHEYDSPGSLVVSEGRVINFAVTEEHRFPLAKRVSGGQSYRFAKVGELTAASRIPVSTSNKNRGCGLDEARIRIAAWLLTDGHFNHQKHRYVAFTQRESNKHKITELLDQIGVGYSQFANPKRDRVIQGKAVPAEHQQVSFNIRVNAEGSRRIHEFCPNKRSLPHWTWAMNASEFEWFLDSFIDGDGTYKTGKSAAIYGTKEILDEMQALCSMNGRSALLGQDRRAVNGYRLSICPRDSARIETRTEVRPYAGKVWCLSVRYGNFMVRRAGKVHFTGNSVKKNYGGPQDNYDWLIAHQISTRLQREIEAQRVTINIPNSWSAFVEVRDRLWCLNHGDDVIGHAGIPWYGFERKNQRVQALVSKYSQRIDYFCYGHYHTPIQFRSAGGKSLHNGAFSFTDDYALNKIGAGGDPEQMLYVVDDKRGIVLPIPIDVRDPESEDKVLRGELEPEIGYSGVGASLAISTLRPELPTIRAS